MCVDGMSVNTSITFKLGFRHILLYSLIPFICLFSFYRLFLKVIDIFYFISKGYLEGLSTINKK